MDAGPSREGSLTAGKILPLRPCPPAGRLKRIAFYPAVRSQNDLDDLLSRCAWYLYPHLGALEACHIWLTFEHSEAVALPTGFDPEVGRRLPAVMPNTVFHRAAQGEDSALLEEIEGLADILLVWREPRGARKPARLARVLGRYARRKSLFLVDAHSHRLEGDAFLLQGGSVLHPLTQHVAFSRRLLDLFASRIDKTKGYIFGTGPSLSSLKDHDFRNGCCIVSNSMVKNRELLERLQPVAIAAADPIFHAGCSSYAGIFRRHLAAAMDAHRCFLFIPIKHYPGTLTWLPTRHHDRIIGVPSQGYDMPYNVDLLKRFCFNPKPNILTMVLLPLAATFFREIAIAGCDGRPISENSYFWSHDPRSQFDPELKAIRQVHPAFFRIDYKKYYLCHCREVRKALEAVEDAGRTVTSLTSSHIPALRERTHPDAAPPPDHRSQAGEDAQTVSALSA